MALHDVDAIAVETGARGMREAADLTQANASSDSTPAGNVFWKLSLPRWAPGCRVDIVRLHDHNI